MRGRAKRDFTPPKGGASAAAYSRERKARFETIKPEVITSGHNCFLYPRAARTAQNGARTCPTKVTSHKTQVTRRFRTCSKEGLASRTDGRPLARIIAHKMSAWVPHRKHTRHRRAVHAPARAEARRRRDIERGRVAERLRPRTTTSRLTCAESSASEFLSRHPPRSNPPMGSVLLGSTHLPAVGRWAGTRHSRWRLAGGRRRARPRLCLA